MATVINTTNGVHIQNQLTRSLERILEDANQSGELKLSNRKLKDFPKASTKYNLSDTVIAGECEKCPLIFIYFKFFFYKLYNYDEQHTYSLSINSFAHHVYVNFVRLRYAFIFIMSIIIIIATYTGCLLSIR